MVDEAEAKALRKAEKRAAKEAAAADEAAAEEKAAKKAKKAAAAAPTEEVDEEEAKRLRKAAKKAAKAAAEAAPEEEVDEEEAKRQRKAAKKAAKAAAAAEAEEEDEVPKKAKKEKRAEAEEDEEAPTAKKSKAAEADDEEPAKAVGEEKKSFKVFIKGLPYSVDEEMLRKDFAECGPIEVLQFPLNEEQKPKGFAFITFATKAGFDAAMAYDNQEYSGRRINVSEALGGGAGKGKDSKGKGKGKDGDWICPNPECGDNVFARNPSCRKCGTAKPGGPGGATVHDNVNRVFIRGLPFSVGEADLRKDFAECGEIEDLKFPLNEESKPKGIAFVKYKTEAGMEAALKFDNMDYYGRTINVLKSGEPMDKSSFKGKGKGKGKDGKDGKDGKGKGKKGKSKAPSESFAKSSGCIVAGAGEKKTFDDSDDE